MSGDKVTEGEGAAEFEKGLERLDEIVSQLREGGLPLAQALALYEEGTRLSSRLREILGSARARVDRLNRSTLELAPFEPPSENR